jgi:trk system potassium uptake protein
MDYRSLVRAVSVLLSIVTVFMLACMIAGLSMGEGQAAVHAFALPVIIGFCLFAFSFFLAHSRKVVLSPREGYLFVTLSWVASASFGALPFILSGAIPSFADALFESMSGFTTTGASVLTDIEAVQRSVLLWRATTHWLGGMGIVVLTVAIFPLLGISGRALMEAEAPGPQVDKFTPRLSHTAAILWVIYLVMTLLLTVLLMFGGMDLFEAVSHSFATMATGGFSTRNISVASFHSAYIDIVLTIFMVLAGTNFAIHWRILNRRFKTAFTDSELRVYLSIFAGASLFIAFNLLRFGVYEGFGQALRYGSFQAATILTTTGFATADYLAWPAFSQAILFGLMFIGGCAGSTGGGIKVSRIITLFKMGLAELRYLMTPRAIFGIFVNKQYMKKTIVYDIAAMVYLYLGTVLISTLVIAWGGFDILTSLSATLATVGNIGPGFSLVGPVFNYAFFPDWITYWLSFIMLIGRLEICTVLILFTRAFWKK